MLNIESLTTLINWVFIWDHLWNIPLLLIAMKEKLTCCSLKHSLTAPQRRGGIAQNSPRNMILCRDAQVGFCEVGERLEVSLTIPEFEKLQTTALQDWINGTPGEKLNTSEWRALSFPLLCSLSPPLLFCIFTCTLIYWLMSDFSGQYDIFCK